ncbi:MAG TPA: serine/threonine-protein kinase [bacterium]|nr:serine/threonine-protein kinase [bacterium]
MEPKKLGRYEIVQVLGQGAMGIVYKGVDPMIGRTVALKTLKSGSEIPEQQLTEFKRRFAQEAQSAGRLNHRNIVTVYDVGEEEGLAYIAMEFIKGRPLDDLIAEKHPFTIEQIVDIMIQICEGLGYAHKNGVIHRDIKPANIVLTDDQIAKVTDFGIAKLTSTSATQTGMVVGTPSYMSPEQITGRGVDNRSDIFSIGAVFYELLTYEKAFPGDNITTVMYRVVHENPAPLSISNAMVPPQFQAIIERAMAKNPADRYPDAETMASDIRNYKTATANMGATQVINPANYAGATVVMSAPDFSAMSPTGTGSMPSPAAAQTQSIPAASPASKKSPVALFAGGAVAAILIVLYMMFGGSGDKSSASSAKSSGTGNASLTLTLNAAEGTAMLDSVHVPIKDAKISAEKITAGEHELVIQSDGYETYRSKLLFADGETKQFAVELKLAPVKFPAGVDTAYITVSSTDMIKVMTNTGTMLGYSPIQRLPFPSGKHTLVFSKPFYTNQVSEIDARKGKEIKLTPKLQAKRVKANLAGVEPKKIQVYLNSVASESQLKPEKDGVTYSLPLGTNKLIVTADGYKSYEQELNLGDDAIPFDVKATLVQGFGSLAITSKPDGADVYVDGKKEGVTPFKMDKIPAGPRDIKVQKGSLLSIKKMNIEADKENAADFTLAASTGILKILINPWGNISVDGKPMGASPPLERLELSPGNHTIKIENPAYKAVTKQVKITVGQTTTLQYDF